MTPTLLPGSAQRHRSCRRVSYCNATHRQGRRDRFVHGCWHFTNTRNYVSVPTEPGSRGPNTKFNKHTKAAIGGGGGGGGPARRLKGAKVGVAVTGTAVGAAVTGAAVGAMVEGTKGAIFGGGGDNVTGGGAGVTSGAGAGSGMGSGTGTCSGQGSANQGKMPGRKRVTPIDARKLIRARLGRKGKATWP